MQIYKDFNRFIILIKLYKYIIDEGSNFFRFLFNCACFFSTVDFPNRFRRIVRRFAVHDKNLRPLEEAFHRWTITIGSFDGTRIKH